MEPPVNPIENNQAPESPLQEAFRKAQRFFWCNTARDVGPGGSILEQRMHHRQFAAAWTDADNDGFHYEEHMERVRGGDLIVMYANLLGIIGIGQAKEGRVSILGLSDPDRMRHYGYAEGHNKEEWRIPVDWLWWDENNPCRIQALLGTFLEITDHADRINAIRGHLPGTS